MDIDVGMWLTLALFVTVIIWLADKALKLRQRKGMIGNTVETSNSLISVLFIVLVIRSFIVEPFTIPSGSMLPTLKVHDFIQVNKFSYGLRLPVTNTKIIPLGEPERKDWLWTEAWFKDPAGNRVCLYRAGKNRRFPPWRVGASEAP